MQIFPEMVPEVDIAETFKRRKNERNKSLAETQLHTKSNSSEELIPGELIFVLWNKFKNLLNLGTVSVHFEILFLYISNTYVKNK